MADVVTFDPDNLRIIEIDTSQAVNVLDAVEVYSEWKDWLLADMSRAGYPPAFSEVAGDPITGTESLGTVFFLENRWRIRPAEYNHKLQIDGDMFTREPGESIFVPTLGSFQVHMETKVSRLFSATTVGVGTAAQVADAVWGASYAGAAPGTMGEAVYYQLIALGLHPTIEVVHGKTFIKAPVDGSILNLKIEQAGTEWTVKKA